MPDLDTDGVIYVYCNAVVSSYKFVVSNGRRFFFSDIILSVALWPWGRLSL